MTGNGKKKNNLKKNLERKTGTRDIKKPYKPTTEDLQVYEMYARGSLSQPQVAEEFGFAQSKVSRIVKKVNEWLWIETMDDIRVVKMQQVQSLQYIYRESMRAWEKSKGIVKSMATKKSPDGFEKTRSLHYSAGDSKYLTQAMNALDRIREITGANAPVEVRHSGELRVAGLSLEDAIAAKIEHLQNRTKLLAVKNTAPGQS